MEGTTTSGAFTGATLAEKLNKLNVSQQSIETLSHWCIFHRKKAREVVETWGKKFHEAPREQRVPFLYLANDILQNSRRKGPEFVNEFWTVLPVVLRDVVDSGDETVRSAAYRLVDIWEERRVFGSRAQSLREELLGKRPPLPMQDVKNTFLPTDHGFEGTMLENVARSYQAIQENADDEYAALAKCNAAISHLESLEKEAEGGTGDGSVQASIADDLLEHQTVVTQCIEQLEGCEMTHSLLCSHLKDALHEQESKLEQLRTHLQIAQAQLDQARSLQHRLTSGNLNAAVGAAFTSASGALASFTMDGTLNHHHENQVVSNEENDSQMIPSPPTPASIAPDSSPALEQAENSTHSTSATTVAAEVAAKLAASSSSAAMLTSVLSSLAAEEANGGAHSSLDGGRPVEKRARLDNRPDSVPGLDSASYQLQPPISQYMGGNMMPMPFAYQSALPPPPPPHGHMILNQHMGLPPQSLPPGCAPAYQPFQQSSMPFYSPPPLPAPPAPAPRQ